MTEPFQFTAETNIFKALELDPRVKDALKGLGLKCVDSRGEYCPAVEVETLSDAARYHAVNLDEILDALNRLRVREKPKGS